MWSSQQKRLVLRESQEFTGLYAETRKNIAEDIMNIPPVIGWSLKTTMKEYKRTCKEYIKLNYKASSDVKGFIPEFIFSVLLNWVINWVVNKLIDSWQRASS